MTTASVGCPLCGSYNHTETECGAYCAFCGRALVLVPASEIVRDKDEVFCSSRCVALADGVFL